MVHVAVLLETRGPDGMADACAPERPVCAVDLRREGIHNERNPSTGRRRGGGDLQVAGRWPQYPAGTRESARRQRPPCGHTLGCRRRHRPNVCHRGLRLRTDDPEGRQCPALEKAITAQGGDSMIVELDLVSQASITKAFAT